MIAAAIAHAKKMSTTWGAPSRTIDPRIWKTYFKTPPSKSATRHYYKEPRHCYDPIPEVDDLTIEGYFQSEKYFSDAKDEVKKALGFPDKRLSSVAIQIRRGDYLLYPDQFPVLPLEYYKQAIDKMIELGQDWFKVYSDDIPFCKKMFGGIGFTCEYSENKDPLADMYEIYNSDAMIIANSTFSLFPSLLRADNPTVVAPAEPRWYGPVNKQLETCDLMPERFIKI